MDAENLVLEPEEIMRVGKFWEASYRARMTVEERLEGLSTEERLEGLAPEERLKGLGLEERLQEFSPEQIAAYLQKLQQS